MRPYTFIPCILTALTAVPLWSQDVESTNYVRDVARFSVTNAFGSDNPIDVFATDPGAANPGATGISFNEFQEQLAVAFAQGRGGIINFDNPVYGGPFQDFDRTGVRSFIEQQVRDAIDAGTNFDEQVDLKAFQDASRQLAIESGIVDFSARIPVVTRLDPTLDDPSIRPESETIVFSRLIGVFGRSSERQLVIQRGPEFYTEGDLATFEAPAAEALGTINGSYFFEVRRPGYGNPVPISLPFSLNSGITDLLFDERENVVSVGFTMLSAGNFQYWQGLSGDPDRPNNLRVTVEYSDGTVDEILNTTRQSSGGHDVFFAVKAPDGESIRRVKVRIVGRNWRTFTFMDDLGFITEPAVPYVANELEVTGSAGAPLFHRILAGQNPDSVSVSGLPAGLGFDPATLLISGVPSESGTFLVSVLMENSVGTNESELVLQIADEVDSVLIPSITNAAELSAAVTVGQALSPLRIETSLDADVQPGDLKFSTIVYRLADDGSRTLTSLDATGTGIADGLLSGTPTSPSQVGSYLVEVYVMNALGGDTAELLLNVFPVVPLPNFDADEATDLIWQDLSDGRVHILPSASTFLLDGQSAETLLDGKFDTGIVVENGLFLGFGDIDSNNHADIFSHVSGAPQAVVTYFSEELTMNDLNVADLSEGWSVQMSGDLRGDGGTSVLWKHEDSANWAVWHFLNNELAWAGLWFMEDPERELVLDADVDGNGVRDLLFRVGPGRYELVTVSTMTGTGRIEAATTGFTLEEEWQPHLVADLSGEGNEDLLWKNQQTGAYAVWYMQGLDVPESARPAEPEGVEDEPESEDADSTVAALPGVQLFPAGFPYEVVLALDVNEDQRNDLLLRHQGSGEYSLLLMGDGAPRSGMIAFPAGSAAYVPVAVGDYNADKRLDVVMRHATSGQTEFWHLGPDGVIGTQAIGMMPASRYAFVEKRRISTDLTPAPQGQQPSDIWQGATALGDRWFALPWFGRFYDSGLGLIYHEDHGYMSALGSYDDLWLYDHSLGWWLQTTAETYPYMFLGSAGEFSGSYVWYVRGTREPREFFEYFLFFDWVTEDDFEF